MFIAIIFDILSLSIYIIIYKYPLYFSLPITETGDSFITVMSDGFELFRYMEDSLY